MVHIKDEGSLFDAPLDMVWKYVQSDVDHGEAHKGRRSFQRKPLSENSVELSWEQEMEGKWIKMANRLTFLPPLGFVVEPIEGPLAGSKFVNYYTPKGEKTEVTVVGEWTSKTIPPALLEKAVMANLEKVYHEDSAAIKHFAAMK
jgi:hypothetical protein